MPQHAHSSPVCRHCAGFATAAVTTGARHRDGSRVTVTADCPICKGHGMTAPAPVLARAGR